MDSRFRGNDNVLFLTLALGVETVSAQAALAKPVLAFPEPGVDDMAAYQGYQTRFFRDSRGNVLQVYLDPRAGRVVNLWADAFNESIGFTVRDATGQPARLIWGSEGATVTDSGMHRTVEYDLSAHRPRGPYRCSDAQAARWNVPRGGSAFWPRHPDRTREAET